MMAFTPHTRAYTHTYMHMHISVILAISPTNVDLANLDSLKLVRSVDPQGRWTIGILTKLDLMDADTHAFDVLTGHMYLIKLGFIFSMLSSVSHILYGPPTILKTRA